MLSFEEKNILNGLLEELWDSFQDKKDQYNRQKERAATYKEEIQAAEDRIKSISEELLTKESSIEALKAMSTFYESKSIRKEIEDIIEKVLSSIYSSNDRRYKFIKKYYKNRHELEIKKVKIDENGTHFLHPIDSTAGGERDIVDIIIRALLLKQFPEEQRILCYDEPMKDISPDLREAFFTFLKVLLETFKIQLIMISHENEYISGVNKKIKVRNINDVSRIERKKNCT